MDKTDMKAHLFEIGELIDEANQCETDLNIIIPLIIGMYQNLDDLNDTLFKVKLNHLKKIWEERKQFEELRIKLNTIY